MEKMMFIRDMAPVIAILGVMGIGGWIFTTWLRVRHGYPLEGSWGQQIKPVVPTETAERLRMLATDNARLSAEVASLKDRIAVLERIATDQPARLASEIDALRTERAVN
jgi:hypothetical protein